MNCLIINQEPQRMADKNNKNKFPKTFQIKSTITHSHNFNCADDIAVSTQNRLNKHHK